MPTNHTTPTIEPKRRRAPQFNPFGWLYNTPEAQKMPHYLTQRVQYMIEQDIQYGTNEGYKSAFRQYLRYCRTFALIPLPITEMKAVYFFAYRTTEVKANTATTNYYGVKKLAMYHGHPVDDSNWEYLHAVRRSIDTVFGGNTPDKRLPITFELLGKMYKYFNMRNYDDFVIYLTMVCATTALARTSEVYAKHKNVSPNGTDRASVKALWNRNLKAYTDQHTKLITHYGCTVRATKTEKGYCDVELVWAKGKFPVTPAELMTEYQNLRIKMSKTHPQLSTAPDAPLFQLLDGSIVTVADMKKRFDILCTEMQLDMQRYTIYSFRIGGATSLARRGVDHRMIQIAGRWRSDAYALYIRMTSKMLATNQADFLQRDVVNRELVFLHQNVPNDKLVRAH